MIKGEAQVFRFLVTEAEEGQIDELHLPARAKAVCFYREDEFHLVDEQTMLRKNDELVLLTYRNVLSKLQDRWKPQLPDTRSRKVRDSGGKS